MIYECCLIFFMKPPTGFCLIKFKYFINSGWLTSDYYLNLFCKQTIV